MKTWPVSQYERIEKIWLKVLNEAVNDPIAALSTPPSLGDRCHCPGEINSYACPWIWPATYAPACQTPDSLNKVHIFMNIAELMSDSESELAFVIAHELGHIIQGQGTGHGPSYLHFVPTDIEWDADIWGLWLSLGAGYDPYGGTGALGRLYTVDQQLLAPNFDGISGDAHGSLTQRLGVIFSELQWACQQPQLQKLPAAIKTRQSIPIFPRDRTADRTYPCARSATGKQATCAFFIARAVEGIQK